MGRIAIPTNYVQQVAGIRYLIPHHPCSQITGVLLGQVLPHERLGTVREPSGFG